MITAAEKLKQLGIKKEFRCRLDRSDGEILFESRPKFDICNGRMFGTVIALGINDTDIDVWTARVTRAKRLCEKNDLHINILDGEAWFRLPANKADSLLQKFGALVRRKVKDSKTHGFAKRGTPNDAVLPEKPRQDCGLANLNANIVYGDI